MSARRDLIEWTGYRASDVDRLNARLDAIEAEAREPLARALAESEERADRLAAAIREFVSPSSSPHPFYGDPERDGHRSGAWPSSECEECERLRSKRWTNLRAALLEGEPDAV